MTASRTPLVVCIGGGTGTFAVVSALKALPVTIGCVIAVSDSGGSTGKIRDEFGFQAVGDLRQSLAALANPDDQAWVQKLLLYRFTKGEGLKGHNLGNLLLTALQDMLHDTTKALEVAEKIFQLQGTVVPITETAVDLKITYEDGSEVIGEHILDQLTVNPKQIEHISLVPPCTISPAADEIIRTADTIIIGPGDYYASLMACLMVPGSRESFAHSNASLVYISNLMTRKTQTNHMTARDHYLGIEQAIGKKLSTIILDNSMIAPNILEHYAKEEEYPVKDDCGDDPRVIRATIASTVGNKQTTADSVERSLLRHDSKKLQQLLQTVIVPSSL